VADRPYENIRLRQSLATYPPSGDPEFLDAIRKGRLFVYWEIPPDGSQQHVWIIADENSQRTSAIFTSAQRLIEFHGKLPAQLRTTEYAMVAGPSLFVLLERLGLDYVQSDPTYPEEARISSEEIMDVRRSMGEVPQLQLRVFPMPDTPAQNASRSTRGAETQQRPESPQTSSRKVRVDTLTSVPLATEVMVPLMEKRVDDAWEAVERLVANNQSDEAMRALALLLWSSIDTAAHSSGADAVEVLRQGASAWAQYADIGKDMEIADVQTIRRLVNEPCGICGHKAVQHDAAWTLWEFGHQTDGNCLVPECACEGFESRA
jgi:hypothetical protein